MTDVAERGDAAAKAPVSEKPLFRTGRGSPRPFGAWRTPDGVNFALFSRNARSVHLVLFLEGREQPFCEIPLDPVRNKTGDVWHVFVFGLPAAMLYGYRVDGPFAPKAGHRFNPKVVLIDPTARSLSGGQPE